MHTLRSDVLNGTPFTLQKGFSSRWDAENPKFQEAVRVILESDLVQLQTSLEDLRSKLLELKPEPNTARSDTLKKQKRRNDLLRQMGKQYAQWYVLN